MTHRSPQVRADIGRRRRAGRRRHPARLRAGRRVPAEMGQQHSGHAPEHDAHQGGRGQDQGRDEGPRRHPGVPQQPARRRHRHAVAGALGRDRHSSRCRASSCRRWCRWPASTASRSRSRITTTVWAAMDGDLGAFVRDAIAKAGLYHVRQVPRQRLPADHEQHQADRHARGPERLQDPRAGEPAVDVAVQGLRRVAGARSTSARSIRRCRPRWSRARKTRCRSSRSPSSTRCRSTAR